MKYLILVAALATNDPPATYHMYGPCYPAKEVEETLRSNGMHLFSGFTKYQLWENGVHWTLLAKQGEYLCYMDSGIYPE